MPDPNSEPPHPGNPSRSFDERCMWTAIDLARKGEGAVEPNPMVGCVIARDGKVIGLGYHEAFGGPHAEINALRSVDPDAVRGATAYVSLEPCCHHGKTPPCSNALIRAGVRRVVIAMTDPFPKVSGGGIEQLRDAGIEVVTGVLEQEARELCAPYLKLQQTGRPWVIAKWAMTIDGRIATATGESQWITCESSRADVHQLRARVDAIAVGMGTVEADDPMLNARLPQNQTPPRIATRVVFCRRRLPAKTSRLVTSARDYPLTIVASDEFPNDDLQPLIDLGASVLRVDTSSPEAMVSEGLAELGKSPMTNLMLEGGSELLASFFQAEQIDECHVYIGPRIFGSRAAPGPIAGEGFHSLDASPQFKILAATAFEDDMRIVYRRR